MRAAVADPSTGSVTIQELSIPLPAPGQVLIRIQSCGLNQIDLFRHEDNVLRKSWQRRVPGVEVVGTVAAFGEGCGDRYSIGDHVFALINEGGLAEFAVADEAMLNPCIPELHTNVLCGIPLAFTTAYHVCFISARIVDGDVVLLHAASSAVGRAILQLLSTIGVKVIATIRREEHRQMCMALGAFAVVNITTHKLHEDEPDYNSIVEKIRFQSGYQEVNFVLDAIGGDLINDNIEMLCRGGKLVVFGMLGDSHATDSDLLPRMMEKDITIVASNVLSQTVEHKAYIMRCLKKEFSLFSNLVAGNFLVKVDRTFPFEQVNEALDLLRFNQHRGKVIVLISSVSSALEEFEREIKGILTRNRFVSDRK